MASNRYGIWRPQPVDKGQYHFAVDKDPPLSSCEAQFLVGIELINGLGG